MAYIHKKIYLFNVSEEWRKLRLFLNFFSPRSFPQSFPSYYNYVIKRKKDKKRKERNNVITSIRELCYKQELFSCHFKSLMQANI